MFNASTTQEAGNTIGSQFGANFDLFTKPLFKLKRFAIFQLDESKSRPLTLRIGYDPSSEWRQTVRESTSAGRDATLSP
jgi:hypothetical protein